MAFVDDNVTVGKTNLAPFFSPLLPNPETVRGVMVIEVPPNSVAGPFFPPLLNRGLALDTIWISMMAEGEWFVIWGSQPPATDFSGLFSVFAPNPSIPPDPSPSATVLVNPSLQCIRIPSDFEYQRKVITGEAFKIRNNNAANSIRVRIEVVSPLPG